MSRTIRRDYRRRVLREGQWPYKCAEGHRCTYCGPAVVTASIEAARARAAAQQVAEAFG